MARAATRPATDTTPEEAEPTGADLTPTTDPETTTDAPETATGAPDAPEQPKPQRGTWYTVLGRVLETIEGHDPSTDQTPWAEYGTYLAPSQPAARKAAATEHPNLIAFADQPDKAVWLVAIPNFEPKELTIDPPAAPKIRV